MLFFTLQPLSSALDCSTVTLKGCVPATCACAPKLVAATATTTTSLLNVISLTPFLVDLTGAWPAPKESLQNDDTDYAARLHPDVLRERNHHRSLPRKRRGGGPKRPTVKTSHTKRPVYRWQCDRS